MSLCNKHLYVGYQWLMLLTLATQEVGIGRMVVQGQSGQNVLETPSQPIKSKMWW
jgi:hypothetical protein